MSLRLCQLTAKWHTEDVEKKKKNNTRLQEAFVFQLLSYAWLFVTPWTVAHQAFLSSVSQGFLKLVSIELVIPSNHLILCWPFSSCPQSFPANWLFTSGGQSIGTSASVSVLPVYTQGWFLLGLTCLISLLSKGFWRVFSSLIVWKHQFFSTQLSLWSNSHVRTWLQKNHSFDCTYTVRMWTFGSKVRSLLFNTLSRLS